MSYTVLFLIALAMLFVFGSLSPRRFRYQWWIDIEAAPEIILGIIANLRTGEKTAPFTQLDPAMSYGFSGPDKGPGAIYWWDGNRKVGKGSLVIVSVDDQAVVVHQTVEQPYRAEFTTTYSVERRTLATRLYCTMNGRHPVLFWILCLLVNCKKLQTPHFEKNLAFLKDEAERHVLQYLP